MDDNKKKKIEDEELDKVSGGKNKEGDNIKENEIDDGMPLL